MGQGWAKLFLGDFLPKPSRLRDPRTPDRSEVEAADPDPTSGDEFFLEEEPLEGWGRKAGDNDEGGGGAEALLELMDFGVGSECGLGIIHLRVKYVQNLYCVVDPLLKGMIVAI